MQQPPKNPYLRDTYSPSTKKLLIEKAIANRQPEVDQEETLNKFSPLRSSFSRDRPEPSRLRNTYSPSTFSSRFLANKTKNDGTPQTWKSAARLTGLSPTLIKSPVEPTKVDKGYSKIQNQLSLLQQRVNRVVKELVSKNSKKIGGGSQLNSISQDLQTQQNTKGPELQKTRKVSRQKSVRSARQKQSSDLKATLKIPELQNLITAQPKPKEAVGFTVNPYSPRNHNIYYVSELVRAINQENSLAREHVKSAIKVLKSFEQVSLPPYAGRMLNLPKSQEYNNKKTVVFDLDETLIHCNQNPQAKSDVKLNIILSTGDRFEAGINIRPYALTLLSNLYKKCELILFTASHSSYANAVLDYLDPQKKLFQYRLFREHCYHSEIGLYVKVLRIINRKPSEIVLIDNAAYSYAFQLQNGIPILSYYQGQDFEMKALQKYIDGLLEVDDVRTVNKKTFKLQHYSKFDNPEELVEQLYMNF